MKFLLAFFLLVSIRESPSQEKKRYDRYFCVYENLDANSYVNACQPCINPSYTQNPTTCQCTCIQKFACTTTAQFDKVACQCVPKTCPPCKYPNGKYVQDPTTCKCSCLGASEVCSYDYSQCFCSPNW